MTRIERATRILLTAVAAVGAFSVRVHAQQSSAPLAHLQFDIVGVRLVVDPPALTVPKNIATLIHTSLAIPPGMGADAQDAILALTAGAQVEAELRGPSLPPTRIAVVPGQPMPIPALAVPGDYFLDGIRLTRNGQTILDATATDGRPATTIPIRVINQVFVASVTSKPLSLDDIRSKGIVIDEKNFSAVNFQVAFNIDGTPFTISAPAVLPTPQLLQTRPDRTTLIQQISVLNQRLAETLTSLPPQFDRPGLNFSIAALPFFPVLDDGNGDKGFDTPPITGLIVIPGNVAFLNQFFSALLVIANVAPDGTPLALHDVNATIALPKGLDGVAGTFDAPGDDPLRLARIEGIGIQPTVVIAQRGPDGKLGTADDITVIPPQKQGEGEFLIEGLKEGSQRFDISIAATLFGLPQGPIKLEGQAAGAVFVRNPTFAVTLAHPRTVRSGEPYNIYATVTNTSKTPANLVSVNLDPRAIAGAQLLSDPTVTFDSIAPGQAVVAKYALKAQLTGQVTFTSFTGDAALGGGIRLETGVDERGVPLAANAIVLPQSTEFLPPSLVEAAQRVLGQAFSVSTAPADALPDGVLFVTRQTVIDRGIELAEAGERVKFGEPLPRVLQDLLLDWLGNAAFDAGFDQIMRTTDAGAAMRGEFAAAMAADAVQAGALDYQRQYAQTAAPRAPHLSAIAAGPAGTPSPILTLTRDSGGTVGLDASGAAVSSLVSGASLALTDGGSTSTLAIVAVTEPERYTIQIAAPSAGVFDLGVVMPTGRPGELQQLRFAAIPLDAGGTARVVIDLTAASAIQLSVDQNGDGAVDGLRAPDVLNLVAGPPELVAVRQLESSTRDAAADFSDPAAYGLLLGALFNTPVTKESAEQKTNYAVASNEIVGTQLQQGGRLVYLYLQKPIGGATPRSLAVHGIVDERGHTLSAAVQPIVTVLSDGAHVFGQVRDAGGAGVGGGILKLTVVSESNKSFDVSAFRTDANGSFDFDFVPRIGDHFTLTAQHPVTRDLASISARIRGAGEQLLLNPTFLGRGTVRGRVIGSDGASAVANVPIALIPGSVLGLRGFQVTTNALGEFTFADVPVGVFTLSASDGRSAFGQATGLIARGGDAVSQDLFLVTQPQDGGRLIGRVFLSDGTTPASGFTVYVGKYKRDNASIAAVDQTTTDTTGTFAFARTLPSGGYDVVAVDPNTGQLGATTAGVVALTTSSVSIILEAVGAVDGVVFNGRGERVAGALVAGGVALVSTDANGFFHIDGVPAGTRSIQAGDPVTRRRGSATVTVQPGLTASAAITLESRATITGRVLDVNGNPVPGASVRIPAIDGYTFVIANNQGVFTFPDLTLGDYLIQAPGPSKESLIDFMQNNGIDPNSAFTSGDAPSGLSDPSTPPSASDTNAVLAAYQHAVQTFFTVPDTLIDGLPMASVGGFGWNKVSLFQDATTSVADIRFLAQGTASGHTLDAAARPTGAAVRISALRVSLTGFPSVGELLRQNTDPATGAFSFAGVPRFDLATFQTAGVRAGDFTLEAASPFSPIHPQFRGQLSTATPNLADIVLQFPAAVDTNGTVSGQIVLPDGVTPAPAGTLVAISFGNLTVTTGADGKFRSVLPIPAGTYTVTAQTLTGLRGQTMAIIPAGGNVDIQMRVLGTGAVTIVVTRPNGVPVVGAQVDLQRASFPADRATGGTDATGRARFVNITEGPFSVTARESITGLTGRSSAAIARDGEVVVPVVITASGTVTGTFLGASGGTPISFAQIVVVSGGVQAYASTDTSGRFALAAIPVGPFTVEGFDPLTNRRGRVTGTLQAEGQTVDVTILEAARGTVTGFVVNADGVTAVSAARVSISASSFVQTELRATALADGSFRFDGIPSGAFTLNATDPVSGFTGTATGTVTFEGELVTKNVALAPFGSVHVTVRDVSGQPVSNASVTIARDCRDCGSRDGVVDTSGEVTFEHLALGSYKVVARSLADQHDGADTTIKIESANQVAEAPVQFRGVGRLTVTVVPASGNGVVASAEVTVHALASTGGVPGPLDATLTGFTDASGTVTFPSVPVGDFSVRAEAVALAGLATGSISAPGATASARVQLGASGTVAGKLLLPDGLTPAANAFATLRFQSQSQLQSGVLQVTTDLTGRFEFRGIPLGTFTLSAIEVVTSGVRSAAGTVAVDGQLVDLGTLTLDNAAPRVVQVSPADRSTNVGVRPVIAITFSEPVARNSVTVDGNGNIALLEGATRVPLTVLGFSADGTTVTIQPTRDLVSGALESLVVRGAPDGPQDQAGFGVLDPFLGTFTVRDSIPPIVLSTSPLAGAVQVPLDAVVRVAFSEPVAGATLALRDGANVLVAGGVTLAVGGTVAIFTPTDFLHANVRYTLTASNIADLAGNALAGGAFTTTFATVDTIPPTVSALQVIGTPRAGSTVTLHPTIPDADVQRVEYSLGGLFTRAATTAPFDGSITLPADSSAATVTAVAFDQAGNRSNPFTLSVAIQANAPPVVTLTNLSGSNTVGQNQTVSFSLHASDDDQLTQLLFSAVGAASVSTVQSVTGLADVTRTFALTVPAAASSGSTITVQAAAIDTAGTQSTPAALTLTVRDAIRPTVSVLTPVNNSIVLAGSNVDVTVDAADDVALATVAVVCNPTVTGCDARTLGPSVASSRQTFTVAVPASFQAPQSIALSIVATDTSGNTALVGRVLQVADTVKPVVTAVDSASGSSRVAAGDTANLTVTFTDNVGVTALVFSVDGGFTTTGTSPVSPAATAGTATLSIPIPQSTANGATVTVHVRARDAASNTSDERSLTLTVGDAAAPTLTLSEPADGATVAPGGSVTVRARATDDVSVRRFTLTATGALALSDSRDIVPATTPADAVFVVAVPSGTPAGALTFSVQAFDTIGTPSAAVTRTVTVLDTTPPQVRITSPTSNALLDPRNPIGVTVVTTDDVGVTAITLGVTGAASSLETRTITPAAAARTETFSVNVTPLPAAGGTLTLTATARDAAGNIGAASNVTVQLRDVVAPQVTSIEPVSGATHVDPFTAIVVRFSEPLDLATVGSSSIQLLRAGAAVPATLVVSGNDDVVTLTPATQPLAFDTVFTIRVSTAVSDTAGNALAAELTSTFTTTPPSTVPPKVVSIDPANGAVDVSLVAPIVVTFSQAIDPASVTPQSFRASVGGTTVAGAFSFLNGNTTVQFTPGAGWPADTTVSTDLTSAIVDRFGNALVAADGSALSAPLHFTFATGRFSLTSPTGSDVVENSAITLEARASATLGVSSVRFTVNGQALSPVSGPPFTTTFSVGSAATTTALDIVASGRDGSGNEIVRDERVFQVVVGLNVAPTLTGVPVGGTTALRFSISSALPSDLPIALSAGDATLVSFPINPAVLTAGSTSVDAVVTGVAAGATAVLGTSSHGVAGAIVAVSAPRSGQTLAPFAPEPGLAISNPPAAGAVLVKAGSTQTVRITLLGAPAGAETVVSVFSTNAAVATVTASNVAAGQRTTDLQITALADGVVTIILRVGNDVRGLTVFVGTPPAGSTPLLLASPVGLSLSALPTLGRMFAPLGALRTLSVRLFDTPIASDTVVTVTTSDANVASVNGSVIVPAGGQIANLPLTTGSGGTATLTIEAAGVRRELTIVVGSQPTPGTTPPIVAAPVGVTVIPNPSIGRVFGQLGAPSAATLGIPLLSAPAAAATVVTITSSNPSVASFGGAATTVISIDAGEQVLQLPVFISGTSGAALLTLEFNGVRRELVVVVGNPPASQIPAVTAPVVGVQVKP